MPNFILNGTEFYDAPKNAGTTIRMWLKYYEGELPANQITERYYNLAEIGMPRGWHNNVVNTPRFFSPKKRGPLGFLRKRNIRWCITRDPIDRFISAYTDKVLRERLVDWSVDTCISMLENGEMADLAHANARKAAPLAACHFIRQGFWLGTSRNFFDCVFKVSSMDDVRAFCENKVFQKKLPSIHARSQTAGGIKKVILSESQRDRLSRAYEQDYEEGWH